MVNTVATIMSPPASVFPPHRASPPFMVAIQPIVLPSQLRVDVHANALMSARATGGKTGWSRVEGQVGVAGEFRDSLSLVHAPVTQLRVLCFLAVALATHEILGDVRVTTMPRRADRGRYVAVGAKAAWSTSPASAHSVDPVQAALTIAVHAYQSRRAWCLQVQGDGGWDIGGRFWHGPGPGPARSPKSRSLSTSWSHRSTGLYCDLVRRFLLGAMSTTTAAGFRDLRRVRVT